MKTVIKVKGMHCKSCDMLVKESLEDIQGVTQAKSMHDKGIVEIEHDESVDVETLKKTITDEGYQVTG